MMVMGLSSVPALTPVYAETVPSELFEQLVNHEGIIYAMNEKEAVITSVNIDLPEIRIPAELSGRPVTSIGMGAFSGKTGIEKVILPDTVISIEDKAFENCSALAEINWDRVSYIGKNAFAGCSSLAVSRLPEGIAFVSERSFMGCASIESVTMPEGVSKIGTGAFMNCTALKNITFSSSLSSVGASAFENTMWYDSLDNGLVYCGSIAYKYKGKMPEGTDVILKEGTVSISPLCFNGCSGMTAVEIPNTVTSIGANSFCGCTGIWEVKIPGMVSYIGNGAFSGCTNLVDIDMADTVMGLESDVFKNTSWLAAQSDGIIYIGKNVYKYNGTAPEDSSAKIQEGTVGIAAGAFSGQSGIISVSLPESLVQIGSKAFMGLNKLSFITIPDGVTDIDSDAFADCLGLSVINVGVGISSISCLPYLQSSITEINISENSPYYKSDEHFIYSADMTKLVRCYSDEGLEEYSVPAYISEISEYAFMNCKGIKKMYVPEEVETVGIYAFKNCTAEVYGYSDSGMDIYARKNDVNFIKYLIEVSGNQWYYSDMLSFDYSTVTVTDIDGNLVEFSFGASPEQVYKDNLKTVPVEVYGENEGEVSVQVGLRGDVNQDGKISASDASLIFSEYKRLYKGQSGKLSKWKTFIANVDSTKGNSKITAQDASYVFSYYKEEYTKGHAKYPF